MIDIETQQCCFENSPKEYNPPGDRHYCAPCIRTPGGRLPIFSRKKINDDDCRASVMI